MRLAMKPGVSLAQGHRLAQAQIGELGERTDRLAPVTGGRHDLQQAQIARRVEEMRDGEAAGEIGRHAFPSAASGRWWKYLELRIASGFTMPASLA